jgi:hypothetical protein
MNSRRRMVVSRSLLSSLSRSARQGTVRFATAVRTAALNKHDPQTKLH